MSKGPKGFVWSFSKLKNYDTCPKRHYEIDIAKNYTDDSEQLQWGNSVHDALKLAVRDGKALPDPMSEYQHWADESRTGVYRDPETGEIATNPSWLRHLSLPGSEVVVEQKYAITKDFQPTEWFANNAWFRGIADVARFSNGRIVCVARDYKTGKVKHDSRQLMLMAQCLFSHIPSLRKVRTEFIWLKDDCKTVETFDRATIHKEWVPILPMVKTMEQAAATMTYPPKPSKICRAWCPVSSCPYHGKSH